jgi:hypothetical protein
MKLALPSLLSAGLLGLVFFATRVHAAPISGSNSLDLDLRDASEVSTLHARDTTFGAGGLIGERSEFGTGWKYRRGLDMIDDDELYARSDDDSYDLFGRSELDTLDLRSEDPVDEFYARAAEATFELEARSKHQEKPPHRKRS